MRYTVIDRETGKLCCAVDASADLCSDCQDVVRAQLEGSAPPPAPPPSLADAIRTARRNDPKPPIMVAVPPPTAAPLRTAAKRSPTAYAAPAPSLIAAVRARAGAA